MDRSNAGFPLLEKAKRARDAPRRQKRHWRKLWSASRLSLRYAATCAARASTPRAAAPLLEDGPDVALRAFAKDMDGLAGFYFGGKTSKRRARLLGIFRARRRRTAPSAAMGGGFVGMGPWRLRRLWLTGKPDGCRRTGPSGDTGAAEALDDPMGAGRHSSATGPCCHAWRREAPRRPKRSPSVPWPSPKPGAFRRLDESSGVGATVGGGRAHSGDLQPSEPTSC